MRIIRTTLKNKERKKKKKRMAANKVWLINKWLLLGEYVGMILKDEKCCLVIWFRVLWHMERKFEDEKREKN